MQKARYPQANGLSTKNGLDEKLYFVVVDVIQVSTDTPNYSDYIKKMRRRDEELSKGWGQFVTPLSVDTIGGKQKPPIITYQKQRKIKN